MTALEKLQRTGIRRVRARKGFVFRTVSGTPVAGSELPRIRRGEGEGCPENGSNARIQNARASLPARAERLGAEKLDAEKRCGTQA